METICGTLLLELQEIWDEVGESEEERDAMLLQIERECLKVYKGKVDDAKSHKAQLQEAIARDRAEIVAICSALGDEKEFPFDQKSNCGGLKRELEAIVLQLEEMKKRKIERKNKFFEVMDQIQLILKVISTSTDALLSGNLVDESDLSVGRLGELHVKLQELQLDKSNRLKLVQEHLSTIDLYCAVLGMEVKQAIHGVHSDLNDFNGPGDLSDDVTKTLYNSIQSLQAVKVQRWQKLQDLGASLIELWNLLDIPSEEQEGFWKLTSHIAASESELTEPNMLAVAFINSVEAEVSRLGQLKSSKIKEIVLKKNKEFHDICQISHMVAKEFGGMEITAEALESGSVDAASLLEQVDRQIAKAKDEAFRRREILKTVEKWMAACEEECWLEEYNRDENHYYAGRGAHLTLKRAEKARTIVNKIPSMVGSLTSKVMAWEKENGSEFSYDGVRLLSMLEQYSALRQEKEQEKQRQREQKKLQDRLMAEREARYGSKAKFSNRAKSSLGNISNKKLSLGGPLIRTQKLSGHRNSEIPAHSCKKHSSHASRAHATEMPLIRKPLSPVTAAMSSKANIMFPSSKASYVTPSKLVSSSNQENTPNTLLTVAENEGSRTPNKMITSVRSKGNLTPKTMPIPVPATPPTLSVPMVTAVTPATPYVPSGAHSIRKMIENIEYSVEEARAGFIFF